MNDRRWETRLLAVIAAVLVVLGLAEVYGASSLVTTAGGTVGARLAVRQAVAALVAAILATVVARLDYHVWQRWAWRLLAAIAGLLLIPLLPFTHPIAPTLNGARRWVTFGVVALQPSELAKFALVVWAATLAAKKGEQIRTFKLGILPFLVIVAPVAGLIFLEPNLSMAVLVAMLVGIVMFAAGARIGHFLLLGIAALPLLFGAVAAAQYRVARVLTFLNPGAAPEEASWQVTQSLVGLGSGQLLGVYPEGIRGWLAKLDADSGNGLRLDPRCFIEFNGLRPHQVRLSGGDASSDSYCFPPSKA